MGIGLLILAFIGVVALWWVMVYYFDIALIRMVIKRLRGEEFVTQNQIKDDVTRFLENRALNKAHKQYMGTMAAVVGGNSLFSLVRGALTIVQGENKYSLELLYDNGLPPYVIIIAIILITIVHICFINARSKRYKADIIASAAAIINEEFDFKPNQEWFKDKSNLNIKNLGKKIDLSINFKYELFEEAFASTCRDDKVAKLFVEERSKLLTDFDRTVGHYKSKIDDIALNEAYNEVLKVVDSLSLKHLDAQALDDIEQSITKVENIFNVAISKKQIDFDDYDYANVRSDLGRILNHIGNDWIQSLKGQSLIVYGKGGYGKTHLLAKIVQRRLEENLPTLFCIGKVITDASLPMDQILHALDVRCKKQTFLEALDNYGKEHGRVLMVVDGINEGVGLSLWENHLLNFLNEIERYDNIGLIISVRTNGGDSWINRFIREEGFPSYKHYGFEKNVSGAVEYMFKSFSVPLPAWPIMNTEFRNPMLLTLFCRSHQGDKTPPGHETRLQIIENYISHFNERLSSFFQYSSSTPVLQDILHNIAGKMIALGNRWRLSQSDLLSILNSNTTIQGKAENYLNALVDEGVLDEYFISEDEHYYTFGYDTMGGFLIASAMVESNSIKGDFLYDQAVVEALTDVVPVKTGKELFEIVKDEDIGFSLLEMFVEGLPMRVSLTPAGASLLQGYLDRKEWPYVFDIVARVPYHSEWPLNSRVLDEILKPLRLVDRDALWTTAISNYTETKDNLLTLVSWAKSASEDVVAHLDKKVLMLICRQLIWVLTTTDLSLRDQTTRALCNLMRNEGDCLLQCIKDYHDVNDDYIVERLYAVVFGCCTGNQSKDYVGAAAQLTYDSLFKDGSPRENILVRDFGKCVIDYAHSLGCVLVLDRERMEEPYCKTKKNVHVPTQEILKYELDYDKIPDKKLYHAQSNIMYSMRTEYSSRGMYGDFGRYTFQAILDNWDDDIEQVSNYAIKYIFEEIGYDANVFKVFDGQHSSQMRHKNSIERIGKKYQWIALHKIAAILADNHHGEKYNRSWRRDMTVRARTFDPTLFMNPDICDYVDSVPSYCVPEYDLSYGDDKEWMEVWKRMPNIENFIEYEQNGTGWVDLYSTYTISSNSTYEVGKMKDKSEREIWTFIHAFIVDKNDRKKICKVIHKEGLGGRSATENGEMSSVYYREYYWSKYYKKEIEDEGLINREFEVGSLNTGINVKPAYLLYTISDYSDASLTEGKEVLMPSPYLYDGLNMKFSVNDGVWLTADGHVASFDSYWVHGGQGCLLIRKDLLLDYLKRENKCLVWPVLMERTYKPTPTFWPRIQCGGYVWMDEKGKLHHKFRSYSETWKDRLEKNLKTKLKKPINRTKLFLSKHGLLKLSSSEALWLMLDSDEDKKAKVLKNHDYTDNID